MDRRRFRSEQVRAVRAGSFAALLSDVLYELRLTHKDVAQRLGIPRYTVDSWTRGDDPKIPSESNMRALCSRMEELRPGSGEALAKAAGYEWPLSTGIAGQGTTQPATPSPDTQPATTPKRSHLPARLSSFVGREGETARIVELLTTGDARLLTLTGPGGVGKTRLALHVASLLESRFEHGAHFVPLETTGDPALVATAIARSLGLWEAPDRTLHAVLEDYLSDREMLLVLDNFEQVLDAAPLASSLMAAAPKLKVIATSRSPLNLYGEKEFAVPPLEVPAGVVVRPIADAAGEHTDLGAYSAVALFVQRAESARADFALTPDNAQAVVEICRRLDSLPLAIELAAARVKLLTPQALLSRLERSLPLLTGGARDLPSRHQTLRDTIAWSYNLLDDAEACLFRCICAFVGGCTLEAIAAVCDGQEIDLLDAVHSLVDKSLLQTESAELGMRNDPELAMHTASASSISVLRPSHSVLRVVASAGGSSPTHSEEPRFSMLETIREYGFERLAEDERAKAEVAQKHASYYLSLAEDADRKLSGEGQRGWLDKLELEHGNLGAVLRWSRATGATEVGLRLAGALGTFWDVRGYWTEGREWLSQFRADSQGAPEGVEDVRPRRLARARALTAEARLARRQGDYDHARALLEESLGLYRAEGERSGVAQALFALGAIASSRKDNERALDLYEQSLEIFRDLDDRRRIADVLAALGWLASRRREWDQARSYLERSLEIYRELGDRYGTAGALNNLGIVLSTHTGEYAAARVLYEESLQIYRELGDKRGVALLLNGIGEAHRSEGDYASALRCYQESFQLCEELGDRRVMAISLHNQGHAALLATDTLLAGKLFREGLAINRRLGDRPATAECLMGLAGMLASERAWIAAARLFGKGEALLREADAELDPTDRAALERSIAAVKAELGQDGFAEARAEGARLTLDELVASGLTI